MRRLCLSGFRLVALFCCLVAPPFAVHDAHNQDKRQNVATFIANLALFQQRLCYARNVSKIGKYIEFDETCHQSRSYQNVMINFRRTACRRRCGQRCIAIDSRTCSFEIFDNEQAVDIKLRSKRIAIGCRIY